MDGGRVCLWGGRVEEEERVEGVAGEAHEKKGWGTERVVGRAGRKELEHQ